MKLSLTLLVTILGLLVCGCANQSLKSVTSHDANTQDEQEIEIPLDQVPDLVKQAALAAVPGIVLEEAEKEIENGVLVYELEGVANGKEYEIEKS